MTLNFSVLSTTLNSSVLSTTLDSSVLNMTLNCSVPGVTLKCSLQGMTLNCSVLSITPVYLIWHLTAVFLVNTFFKKHDWLYATLSTLKSFGSFRSVLDPSFIYITPYVLTGGRHTASDHTQSEHAHLVTVRLLGHCKLIVRSQRAQP